MATAAVAKKNGKPDFEELISISRIASKCGLDRATCKKRLDLHGYAPIDEQSKLKLYRFDAEMEANLTETQDKLGEVRVRKEKAAAEKIEIQVAQARGELLPTNEVTDIVQRLFGAFYKEKVRMIKRWAPRVAKMKAAADIEKLMMTDFQRLSNSLRADFQKFVPELSKNGNGRK